MRKKVVNKLMVNWFATFASIVLLLSMVAMPAIALVVADEVESSSIKDGEVKTPDLGDRAVTNQKIANNAVTGRTIRDGSLGAKEINPLSRFNARRYNYSETRTGYASVSALSLTPTSDNMHYLKIKGRSRMSLRGKGRFFGNVSLPQGANVTGFRFYRYDRLPDDSVRAKLTRVRNRGSYQVMASVNSNNDDTPGWRTHTDNTINYASVNNNLNSYLVEVKLSTNHPWIRAGNAVIEYTYTHAGD